MKYFEEIDKQVFMILILALFLNFIIILLNDFKIIIKNINESKQQ
jgi:hypothetical protein